MSFLDFIKNRHAQQQDQAAPAPEQRTETAREMYARRDIEQEKSAMSPEQLPPDQQAKVAEVNARLNRTMGQEGLDTRSFTPEEAGDSATSQPMAQKTLNQDKTAPMLTPTTEDAGVRATEQKTEEPAKEIGTQAQERSQQQRTQQTVARRPPSWER